MYRGRFQIGDEIPLAVLTTNGSGVPVAPDSCPSVEIYGPSGKVQDWIPRGKQIPVMDRFATTGFFQGKIFLGSMFTTGLCTVAYRWTSGAYHGQSIDTFEILPGGSDRGHVIALDWYHCPQADFLIQQLDSGRIRAGRNPRF